MFQMFSLDFSVWIKLFLLTKFLVRTCMFYLLFSSKDSAIMFYCNDTKTKTTKHNGLSLFVFAITVFVLED